MRGGLATKPGCGDILTLQSALCMNKLATSPLFYLSPVIDTIPEDILFELFRAITNYRSHTDVSLDKNEIEDVCSIRLVCRGFYHP